MAPADDRPPTGVTLELLADELAHVYGMERAQVLERLEAYVTGPAGTMLGHYDPASRRVTLGGAQILRDAFGAWREAADDAEALSGAITGDEELDRVLARADREVLGILRQRLPVRGELASLLAELESLADRWDSADLLRPPRWRETHRIGELRAVIGRYRR